MSAYEDRLWCYLAGEHAALLTDTAAPKNRAHEHGRRPDSRRFAVGLSLAAAALAAAVVAVGLTLTAAAPPNAYAAAKRALAATAAASSGTMTVSVSHDGSSRTLGTTQWNGNAIETTRGEQTFLPIQALILADGGAYVEQADGTWMRYASASDAGLNASSMGQFAQNNVGGATANQVLALATGLTATTQPDGSTIYTGTIPNSKTFTGIDPNDDAILGAITSLSDGPANVPGTPGGYHDGLQLTMTVGADGFVRRVSLTYQQQDANVGAYPGSPDHDGSYTFTVSYSQLGSTPPITPPATYTPAPRG